MTVRSPGGSSEDIVWLDRHDPSGDLELGAKNARLASLTAAGFPVPPGFAVTAAAYRRALRQAGVDDQLRGWAAAPVAPGAMVRELVLSAPLPGWLLGQLERGYRTLSARCGTPDVPVAVRSSATGEDLPDASSAGMHDTYLGVRSAGEVARHVRRCWASLYTDRASAYRRTGGYSPSGPAMSVAVQQMVFPVVAGVAFTLDPADGDRSRMVVEAAWGLGETVVRGIVTPDNYAIDKASGQVVRRTVSDKKVERRVGADAEMVEVTVEATRRHAPCLTDDQVRAVARLASRAEEHFGSPQDVEWAIEHDGTIWLLQSRPDTARGRRIAAAERPRGGEAALSGFAASPGVAEGFARVVPGLDAIDELQDGEILVAPHTTPSWVAALGRVAAVVTDTGGITSHAAIVCREFGVPAVTGTRVGTETVTTGQRLLVDGNTGLVAIIG